MLIAIFTQKSRFYGAIYRFRRYFPRVFVRLNVRLTHLFRFDLPILGVRFNVRISVRFNLKSKRRPPINRTGKPSLEMLFERQKNNV